MVLWVLLFLLSSFPGKAEGDCNGRGKEKKPLKVTRKIFNSDSYSMCNAICNINEISGPGIRHIER